MMVLIMQAWQKQENALGIQQVIEEALYKITKENVDVVASGRTDALEFMH